MSKIIFVPRLMDDAQLNPQNKNAQAILARWDSNYCKCRTLTYGPASSDVIRNHKVRVRKLWRRRLWLIDLFLQYLRYADLIFYIGGHPFEHSALRWRSRLCRRIPVVATIEGLMGNPDLEREYSEWAGHEVYCQHVDDYGLQRWNEIYDDAKHIIAISPFLAKMGRQQYGDKVSFLPLGVDISIFHDQGRTSSKRMRIISAGRLESHKRPELMMLLADKYPQADFIWFGEGSLRELLIKQAAERRIENLQFPGSVFPSTLAQAMRNSDIFIMPSKSEGVPKVTQEAAACGLAQVIFGFYEAPSVIDGINGFVVWEDSRFIECVGELIESPGLAEKFGKSGAEMAKDLWDWNKVAPQWEQTICRFL